VFIVCLFVRFFDKNQKTEEEEEEEEEPFCKHEDDVKEELLLQLERVVLGH